MKAYTDLEQSKKLAKILPLESADMAYYQWKDDGNLVSPVPFVLDGMEEKGDGLFDYIPCWSLVALLNATPQLKIRGSKKIGYIAYYNKNIASNRSFNIIGACYETIIIKTEKELKGE